jgi:DNA-binding transcriptional ArsR family regulator
MTYDHEGFVALADPFRRRVFERLARRPASVGELARYLPISRPAVSQHLKVLKDARLVRSRKEGTRNVYQIDTRGIESMRDYLDRLWTDALASFKHAIEEKQP